MDKRIYLDNNATTPLEPDVAALMVEGLKEAAGNPSSIHHFGQVAKGRLVKARQQVAQVLGVKPREIVFTSGGTEGVNMLIRGVVGTSATGHVVTSNLEHSSTIQTVQDLENQGCDVTWLAPGSYGAVKVEQVQAVLRPDTRLIALMAVNNETGVKTDIQGIATLAQRMGIPFVVDAVAWMGKEPVMIPEGVTGMAFSGHKFHAPQGAGMAYVRRGISLYKFMAGGTQEGGRRGGTENVAGIMGLGAAAELLPGKLPVASEQMRMLRDLLEDSLKANLGDVFINGEGPRICNTSNLAFLGVDGEALLMNLDLEGVAVSHGSACTAGALEPSRVLLNMGFPRERASSSIRISLSRMTTREEVERAVEIITAVVRRLRAVCTASG